jgi:colanic acid/amylovoran biosynthesis glycosyltransferase
MSSRVAYAIRMFPQRSETFILNEVLALERLGLEVCVFSYLRPKTAVSHESLRLLRTPVTYLPDPLYCRPRVVLTAHRALRQQEPARYGRTLGYLLSSSRLVGRPRGVRRSLDAWHRFMQAVCLASLLKRTDVEHIHAHFAHEATSVAMLASMLTGIPYSFTAHARDIFSHEVDLQLLREKVQRAQAVVAVSRFNHDFLTRAIGPLANDRVRTVYNGVDLRKFSPDPAVVREGRYILGVGRLVQKKGFSVLVEACQILRQQGHTFTCDIVGEGEQERPLADGIRRHGLDGMVRLAGFKTQEELPLYYRRATVVALPSVVAEDGNRDGLPTTLLEAMGCGAPVVASRLTGIPEIVPHGWSGLLAEPGNAVDLAHAIGLLFADHDLRQRLGSAGRARAERLFDVTRNAGELARLFGHPLEMSSHAA